MREHRLYHRIYLSLLLVAVLSIGGTGIASHTLLDQRFESPVAGRLIAEAEYIASTLPSPDAPVAETQAVVRRLAEGLRLDVLLLDPLGHTVASTVTPPPHAARIADPLLPRHPAWMMSSHGYAFVWRLEDGRRLALWPREPHPRVWPILAVFFGLLALGCLPIARRLTRRLEALEQGVARLGSGQLDTRVTVCGRDEIARVAQRFNWAAERIAGLVEAQRRMLRSASHEIRSPLTRVRMALELVRDSASPEVAARVSEAVRETVELDGLVDDILLASRMETEADLVVREEVDLAAIVTEEAARAGASAEVTPVTVTGDPRLLRRLVRNLLENAVRHGGKDDIQAGVAPREGAGARLWVADRGPGVPPGERERIFEPFYRSAGAPVGGAGLGLSLVRQIAERHSGAVVCRGREGGGALFEVTLGRID
jgi:signal transduction histidine kinase